jgi:hypothetical protein
VPLWACTRAREAAWESDEGREPPAQEGFMRGALCVAVPRRCAAQECCLPDMPSQRVLSSVEVPGGRSGRLLYSTHVGSDVLETRLPVTVPTEAEA